MDVIKKHFSRAKPGDGNNSSGSCLSTVKSVSVIDKYGEDDKKCESAERKGSTDGLFPLELLPQNVLSDIFRRLPFVDFLRMQRVNHRFRDICVANPPTAASFDYRAFAIRPSGQEFRYELEFKSFMNKFLGKYGGYINKFEISAPAGCQAYLWRVRLNDPYKIDRTGNNELICCSNLTFLSLKHIHIDSTDLKAIGVSFTNLIDLELPSKLSLPLKSLPQFPRLKRLHSKLHATTDSTGKPDEIKAAKIVFFNMEKVAELYLYLPFLHKLFDTFEDHAVPSVKTIALQTQCSILRHGDVLHEQLDLMKYLNKFPTLSSINLGSVLISETFSQEVEIFPATVTTLLMSQCRLDFELNETSMRPRRLNKVPRRTSTSMRLIDAIRRFENLEVLEISGNIFSDDDDFSILSAFKKLKRLKYVATIEFLMNQEAKITSFPASALLNHLPAGVNLSEADFEDMAFVLNKIAQNLVLRNMRLRKLRLFNLPATPVRHLDCNIGEPRITAGELAAKMTVHWTLDPEPVKQLVKLAGRFLESLTLVGHLKIDDSFLEFLSASPLDRLECLDLSRCAVTDEGVDRFLISRKEKIEATIILPFLHLRCSLKSMNKYRMNLANGAKVIFDEIIDPDGVLFEKCHFHRSKGEVCSLEATNM